MKIENDKRWYEKFSPELLEEMTGYTMWEMVSMFEDYDRAIKENEHYKAIEGKGTTEFDKRCHRIFESKDGGEDYLARKTGVKCGNCGHELLAYYCESRLYMVKCDCCEIQALVKAGSPSEAAYRTFGNAVYSIEDMGEECAVFFAHVPIDEPPAYVGSTIDCDFPWNDVVCGMHLPCPGTNGKELRREDHED